MVFVTETASPLAAMMLTWAVPWSWSVSFKQLYIESESKFIQFSHSYDGFYWEAVNYRHNWFEIPQECKRLPHSAWHHPPLSRPWFVQIWKNLTIPRLVNYQIQLLVLFCSPVPCPLFAGEVGDKVVDGVLDGLLSSTVAQLRSHCICSPRICLFLINFAHLKVSTILWNSRGLSSWGLIL